MCFVVVSSNRGLICSLSNRGDEVTVNSRIKSTSGVQRGRRNPPARNPKTAEHGPTAPKTYKRWDPGGVSVSAIICVCEFFVWRKRTHDHRAAHWPPNIAHAYTYQWQRSPSDSWAPELGHVGRLIFCDFQIGCFFGGAALLCCWL